MPIAAASWVFKHVKTNAKIDTLVHILNLKEAFEIWIFFSPLECIQAFCYAVPISVSPLVKTL